MMTTKVHTTPHRHSSCGCETYPNVVCRMKQLKLFLLSQSALPSRSQFMEAVA